MWDVRCEMREIGNFKGIVAKQRRVGSKEWVPRILSFLLYLMFDDLN